MVEKFKEVLVGFDPRFLEKLTNEAEVQAISRNELIRSACGWYLRFIKCSGPVLRAYRQSTEAGALPKSTRGAMRDEIRQIELSDRDGGTIGDHADLEGAGEDREGPPADDQQEGGDEAQESESVHLQEEG